MTLGRLILAWLVVSAWSIIGGLAMHYVISVSMLPVPGVYMTRKQISWHAAEAALLTLIASLWFDSLGSGGWWLLFLLLGLLTTLPQFLNPPPIDSELWPRKAHVGGAIASLVRYQIAGALLAWRLS